MKKSLETDFTAGLKGSIRSVTCTFYDITFIVMILELINILI